MKYEDIKKVNKEMKTTTISRYDKKTGQTISKEYAEVNERIKAFRKVYPEGFIITQLVQYQNGRCMFRAEAGHYTEDGKHTLGVGHAEEKEGSSFINETSFVENCETSAIGRCLATIGFGIDTSIASYEEVKNAIENQTIEKKDIKIIEQMAKEYNKEISDICKAYKINTLNNMTKAQYADCLKQFQKIKENK